MRSNFAAMTAPKGARTPQAAWISNWQKAYDRVARVPPSTWSRVGADLNRIKALLGIDNADMIRLIEWWWAVKAPELPEDLSICTPWPIQEAYPEFVRWYQSQASTIAQVGVQQTLDQARQLAGLAANWTPPQLSAR